MKRVLTLIALLTVIKGLYAKESETFNKIKLQAGWASNYLSEGRENLPNEGLFTFEAETLWKGLALGAWLWVGDASAYKELNVWVSYPFQIDPLDFYVGYTRLAFLDTDEYDNELIAGLSLEIYENISTFADAVYSTEQSGTFLELGAQYSLGLLNDSIELTPYFVEGFDFGYASEPFSGMNHFQFGVEASVKLMENGLIKLNLSHSHAHKDVRLDGGGNTTLIGLYYEISL